MHPEDEDSADQLMGIAYIDFMIFTLLALLSIIGYKPLLPYLNIFNMTGLFFIGEDPSDQNNTNRSLTPKFKVEVEKQQKFFSMLSSTYFLPLHERIPSKNQDSIKRIKKVLRNMHPRKLSFKQQEYERSRELTGRAEVQQSFQEAQSQEKMKSINIEDLKNLNALDSPIFDIKRRASLKRQFSADDVDSFKTIKAKKQADEIIEEKLCYICYENSPNAVLVNCGHGGICYNCAMLIMKKSSECMECRTKFDAVYKVDMLDNFVGIARGVEVTKILKSKSAYQIRTEVVD